MNGQEIEVNSFQSDVQGVLDENNIDYNSNDIISEDLDASLEDGMKIEVNQVTKETIIETEDIPYDTVVKKDSTLLKGENQLFTFIFFDDFISDALRHFFVVVEGHREYAASLSVGTQCSCVTEHF